MDNFVLGYFRGIIQSMIGYLTGTVLHTTEKHLLLDVGGVGYKVYVTVNLLSRGTGSSLSLWVHTIVREDVLDLYGFEKESELEFFKLLLGVSGVGPRGALGVLDVAPVETLQAAIASGDTSYLTKVSGIGKKSAEKIVLELRDKMDGIDTGAEETLMHEDLDVVEALVALGYREVEAREALGHVPEGAAGTSEKVGHALKYLGG